VSWQTAFELTNAIALGGWLLLAFAPRKPLVLSAVMYLGIGLLCLAYLAMFVALTGGFADPVRAGPAVAFSYDVAGIRALMASDGGATIVWTHILAFDLFVGLWIARDADGKSIGRLIQLPFLFLTFVVGPIGLLGWLVLREVRRRGSR
jgi:Domain of unknown function (DUF4281)